MQDIAIFQLIVMILKPDSLWLSSKNKNTYQSHCDKSHNIFTVVKELRSKMFGQHPGYFKAVFLKKTQIIIVSIYKYTVYLMFWIMMPYDCYYYFIFAYWQIRFLINNTNGLYTCLHSDQARFQKHLLTSSFRV
jgi:hypothetical protein